MKIDWNPADDSAYVTIKDRVKKGDVVFTTPGNQILPDPWHRVSVEVTFQFEWDKDGRMLGFSVQPASLVLPVDTQKA